MLPLMATVGTPDPTVIDAITTGSVSLLPTLLAAGALGVGVSIGAIGLRKGFGFFRSLIKV